MKLASVSRWTLLIAVILVGSALMTPWATASDKAIASDKAASGIPTRPEPARLCNDFTGTLTAAEMAELEAFCVALDRETSVQLCLVVVQDMDGMEVSDFANRLFERWGIGRAQQDDGVLLLMALSERKIRIENGYGLESILTDALSRRLIEQDIVPAMRANGLAAALNAGANGIAAIVRGEYSDAEARPEGADGEGSGGISLFWLVFWLVMIVWILGSLGGGIGGGGRSVGRGGTRSMGGPIFFPGGGFGGGGGGFGGGGFGGFGGGMSGGGGASGSW
ncbi:MAG: TPM domain-containing protein [Bacteroidetes bacterium]|nr:TPM domain-containing protein [Bacteroidota bacterium]